MNMPKRFLFGAIGVIGLFFLFSAVYFFSSDAKKTIQFEIRPGESTRVLAAELKKTGIIRSESIFRIVARLKEVDTNIKSGTYTIEPPITIFSVLNSLSHPDAREEKTITILPGWDLRDIAEYLVQQGVASSTEAVYKVTGLPADTKNFYTELVPGKPGNVSLEGYLAPDTYRIFVDASVEDVIKKLTEERMSQLVPYAKEIQSSGLSLHEVLTLASMVEREARLPEARAVVADIFLRRLKDGWPLQADSTVQYVIGKKGDVFTTGRERSLDSPWNTYKYPGLPVGPIANPSMNSIEAVLRPTKNDYWYFISTLDGEMKYAKTIEEHQKNVATYLR
jgi:UPF0755 protein